MLHRSLDSRLACGSIFVKPSIHLHWGRPEKDGLFIMHGINSRSLDEGYDATVRETGLADPTTKGCIASSRSRWSRQLMTFS